MKSTSRSMESRASFQICSVALGSDLCFAFFLLTCREFCLISMGRDMMATSAGTAPSGMFAYSESKLSNIFLSRIYGRHQSEPSKVVKERTFSRDGRDGRKVKDCEIDREQNLDFSLTRYMHWGVGMNRD